MVNIKDLNSTVSSDQELAAGFLQAAEEKKAVVRLDKEDAAELYRLLYKLLSVL